MTLVALIVSVVAVLVSLSGAYFLWRQVRAAEEQTRTARDTLTRQIADTRLAGTPRLVANIESDAVDRNMRLKPTALLIKNSSVVDLNDVQVELSSPIPGLKGFRIGRSSGMVAKLEVLRSGESRRIPLSLEEPGLGPQFLQGNLTVAANGDTWNTTLPLSWTSSRFDISQPHVVGDVQLSIAPRILPIILGLSALIFVLIALIRWLS
jgi:hypothetical protein